MVVDNTWATPLYHRPLQLGADISLHSATKYMSGHSDVMGGLVLTDRDDLAEDLRQTRFYGGLVLAPESAWLLRRSLQTMPLRLQQQGQAARTVRDFLAGRDEVSQVYYPEVDGEQLSDYGALIFFRLKDAQPGQYERFRDALQWFGNGTAMACVTSMVAQPYSGSHASMTEQEKRDIDLGEDVVRLSIGLEALDDLLADLAQAL